MSELDDKHDTLKRELAAVTEQKRQRDQLRAQRRALVTAIGRLHDERDSKQNRINLITDVELPALVRQLEDLTTAMKDEP